MTEKNKMLEREGPEKHDFINCKGPLGFFIHSLLGKGLKGNKPFFERAMGGSGLLKLERKRGQGGKGVFVLPRDGGKKMIK